MIPVLNCISKTVIGDESVIIYTGSPCWLARRVDWYCQCAIKSESFLLARASHRHIPHVWWRPAPPFHIDRQTRLKENKTKQKGNPNPTWIAKFRVEDLILNEKHARCRINHSMLIYKMKELRHSWKPSCCDQVSRRIKLLHYNEPLQLHISLCVRVS